MSLELILTDVAALAAVVAAGTAMVVAFRAEAWRKGDEGKALIQRIEKAERSQNSEAGKAMAKTAESAHRRIDKHDEQLTKLSVQVENLPTASDFSELQAEIKEVAAIGGRTEAGVGRLEGYFLQMGVERAR